MKMKQKMKIIWIYFTISMWAFGFAYDRDPRAMKNEDVGEEVFVYNAPNKTEMSQFQPRNGESIRIPRQQSKDYEGSESAYKSTMTDSNSQFNKRSMQNALEVPILIYRGPHRPRELYHYRPQTKAKGEENPKYIGAASRQVYVNQGNARNNKFSTSDKNTKRNSKDSLESNPVADKGMNQRSKKLYEDISILREPHVESTLSRPTSSYYYVPEKQNYAIYSGGIFDNEDSDIEAINSDVNSDERHSSDYKATFKTVSRTSYDPLNDNYSPNDKLRNKKAQIGPKRRSSNIDQSGKLYSRNYDERNFTPSLTVTHPGVVDDQFEVMDHYDGGFSPPKPKRENLASRPAESYYRNNNFGKEFDYENYDTNYTPVKRLHRASKVQPEYDGDLNFQESSGFLTTSRPPQSSNINIRINRNGRQRRRKGHTSSSRINSMKTDYEVQPHQSGTGYQPSSNYQVRQSPSRNSERTPRFENHDIYATTAAIEDTYANVEIRRTQPKAVSKSSPRSSGRKRRRRTTSRVTYYNR